MNSKEALEVISGIELSHMEYDEDENMDGEMEYSEYEEYDGTIEENYPREINIIKNDLAILDLLKGAITKVEAPGYAQYCPVEGGTVVNITSMTNFVANEIDKEYIKTLTNWVIQNIDKETVRHWLEEK